MRRSIVNMLAAGCMAFLAGCLFPRYTAIGEEFPSEQKGMTLAQASAIARDAIANPPAGRRPSHPGDRALGKYTTSIRLRKHTRTGYVLVEVKEGPRVTMEFYVRNQADADKFVAAVWRLRQEYLDK